MNGLFSVSSPPCLEGLVSALDISHVHCKAISRNILGAQNGPVDPAEHQQGSFRVEACRAFITQRLIKRRKFRELIEAEREISKKQSLV